MTTRDHSDGGGTCFLSYWKVFKKQINTLLEMHHLKQALNVCMFGFFFFTLEKLICLWPHSFIDLSQLIHGQ